MGDEYTIKFAKPSDSELDHILRRAPCFSNFDDEFRLYNYSSDLGQDSKAMPDAAAKIEQDGIYFCYYGGTGAARATLGFLVQKLARFGKLSIDEL